MPVHNNPLDMSWNSNLVLPSTMDQSQEVSYLRAGIGDDSVYNGLLGMGFDLIFAALLKGQELMLE
jgi:hypothetical protein